MNRTVFAGVTAAALLLIAVPAAHAGGSKPKLYTTKLTGNITQAVTNSTTANLQSSSCDGSQTTTEVGSLSAKVTKTTRRRNGGELGDGEFLHYARLTNPQSSWSVNTDYNYTPLPGRSPGSCPSEDINASGSCVLRVDDPVLFELKVSGGRYQFENGEEPGGLWAPNAEGEPGACSAEQNSGGGFLKRTPIKTTLTLRKVKALKKGKSVSASGPINASLSDQLGGGGTRTVTVTGDYKLTIKRTR